MARGEEVDVLVVNHGSMVGFTPLTQDAKDWVEEHIPDDAQWLGPTFFAEHRYAPPIADGMIEYGLVVS